MQKALDWISNTREKVWYKTGGEHKRGTQEGDTREGPKHGWMVEVFTDTSLKTWFVKKKKCCFCHYFRQRSHRQSSNKVERYCRNTGLEFKTKFGSNCGSLVNRLLCVASKSTRQEVTFSENWVSSEPCRKLHWLGRWRKQPATQSWLTVQRENPECWVCQRSVVSKTKFWNQRPCWFSIQNCKALTKGFLCEKMWIEVVVGKGRR